MVPAIIIHLKIYSSQEGGLYFGDNILYFGDTFKKAWTAFRPES